MARTTITTTATATTKKRAARPGARKSVPKTNSDAVNGVTEMIAEAAYYKAKARGFVPGHEESDWLSAERDVLESLNSG